jgi:predicted DNA-binding protein YlxM (UPF0122 family)
MDNHATEILSLLVTTASKNIIVLALNTKVKVIKTSEEDTLSMKGIVTKFNVGKAHVYDVLKAKMEIRSHWQNCSSGSVKLKLRKTGNKDIMK